MGLGMGPRQGGDRGRSQARKLPRQQRDCDSAESQLRLLRSGEVSLGIYLRRFHVTVPQDGGCDVESKLVPDAGRGCVAQGPESDSSDAASAKLQAQRSVALR